jgi:hypothetical protein
MEIGGLHSPRWVSFVALDSEHFRTVGEYTRYAAGSTIGADVAYC